jgi:hypothetical protein
MTPDFGRRVARDCLAASITEGVIASISTGSSAILENWIKDTIPGRTRRVPMWGTSLLDDHLSGARDESHFVGAQFRRYRRAAKAAEPISASGFKRLGRGHMQPGRSG